MGLLCLYILISLCLYGDMQWLSAVELTLMKGRHPLLKDMDIAIRPPKGKSFVNGEPVNPVPNITCKNINSSKHFLNSMDANNHTMQLVTSETSVDNLAQGREGRVSRSSNSEGLGETLMENSENAQDTNTNASQDGTADVEKSMDLQTATVIMNMLDVTMPGTLDEECKKKALRIEFGRILGIHDLECLENNLIKDLDLFSDAVSRAIVHENMVDMELDSKCIDTADHIILGKIEAADVIKIISSTLSETSHLRKAIPSGNIVDACLASLRTYFSVVPLDDDHNGFVDKRGHENELVNAPAYIKDQHVDSDSLIKEGSEESLEKNIKTGGIMVGAFTAALGASALVAQNQVLYDDTGVTTSWKGGKIILLQ